MNLYFDYKPNSEKIHGSRANFLIQLIVTFGLLYILIPHGQGVSLGDTLFPGWPVIAYIIVVILFNLRLLDFLPWLNKTAPLLTIDESIVLFHVCDQKINIDEVDGVTVERGERSDSFVFHLKSGGEMSVDNSARRQDVYKVITKSFSLRN